MDKHNRHSNNNLDKYLKYFSNLFSGKERHAFEKDMMKDTFEEEAFEGLSQLRAGEFRNDMAELQKKVEKRTRSRKTVSLPFLRYAAAAVLILGLGTIAILVRQSSKNASELAENRINEDTMLHQKTVFQSEDDSLKKNIAYKPDTKKGSEKKGMPEAAAKRNEIVLQQPDASPEITIDPASADEVLYDTDYEAEEMAEAEQSIRSNASGTDAEKKRISEASKQENTEAKRNRNLKTERSKAASPSDTSSEKSTVTGCVLSASDEAPLPGVTILLKGTATGTVSDINGNFRIDVPVSDSSVLQFAYLGFTTEEMEVGNLNEMTVTLNEELMALDEVVVVGYGTMRKSNVTGAIASVQLDEEPSVAPIIVPPKPVIGLPAYKQYIRENIRYDKLPEFNKPVIVKLSFRVSENGKISTVVIEKSEDHSFDQEAIRLVKEGPSWSPGTEDSISVTKEVTLKIKFEPRE